MFSVPNGLKIVVIDPPYDSLSNPEVQSLMGKVQALKLTGYRAVYPYGILPVDTYDIIASHHLVCREDEHGSLTPLMGYRSVTLERCQMHRIAFPGMTVVTTSAAHAHEKVLRGILDRVQKTHGQISYGSSWTIDPAIRDEPELKAFLKNMMGGMLVCQEQETRMPERVGCGALRFKTDLFFQSLGYKLLEDDGKPLETFAQASLFGEQAVMMHCRDFSPLGLKAADRIRSMWDARTVLSASAGTTEKKAAA